ncbi:hypothetical protein CLAFUW4_14373 [Fulvia fulva]|uniref:Heterokaryon incompatibility domain-containing protein n=1 Tax=Passalora fulva TaxID=5499 RepID=A0A9Q8UWP8_PASFU|nr:uncharacterized protein CLAFUR5_14204 [Fulvia fulva]KAK4609958.1 hypothetical protein CLAFUR0_14374 [Fulvia fulva]UJO25122.1 hypothetical protein CLAFUR5_14204 [Fulvia fulva]WPV22553.1 hypothetical protein CLAFUW4_14373 [Fulvia fulva]
MGDIYSGASMVQAYLGIFPSSEMPSAAMSKAIMRHNIWSRSWIIQELVRSRDYMLLIGPEHEIGGHAFREDVWTEVRILELAGTYGNQAANNVSSMVSYWYQLVRFGRLPHILGLLEAIRSRDCTDGRHSLFSKLGVARNASSHVPSPSYELEAGAIFTDFVRSYFTNTGSLYIVCLSGPTNISLPSWVPDWPRPTGRQPLLLGFGQSNKASMTELENIITSSARWELAVTFPADHVELSMLGWVVDDIGDYADHVDATNPLLNAFNLFWGLDYFAILLSTLTGAQKNADGDGYLIPPGEYEELAHVMAHVDGDRASRHGCEDAWILEHSEAVVCGKSMPALAREYLVIRGKRHRTSSGLKRSTNILINKMSAGRKLAGTKRGWPVLVPTNAVGRDLICVLWYCPVPVVLRKVHDHYIPVGECYHYEHMSQFCHNRTVSNRDDSNSSDEDKLLPVLPPSSVQPMCWENLYPEGRPYSREQPDTLFNIR